MTGRPLHPGPSTKGSVEVHAAAAGPLRPPAATEPTPPRRAEPDTERADSRAIPIVLVGKTGLEGVLRLDDSFEVYRAPDGPSALGQLSQLHAAKPGATAGALVVVAPDSDAAGRLDAFRAAIGVVSSEARVVRISPPSSPAAQPFEADAASERDDTGIVLQGSAESIRTALRKLAARTPIAEPCRVTDAVVDRVMTAAPGAGEAPAIRGAEPLDTPMLRAMLSGRDIRLAGLDTIRRALDAPDVYLADAETSGASIPAGARRVRVAINDRTFGELISASADVRALSPWADWLAHWLALREQQENLRAAALTDELTGAWNRRYFTGFLSAALNHARDHGHSVTVLYFDIDNFKTYNDRFGHDAGDEILRETVRLLTSVIRPSDRVCRIGGDEFGVVFHEPDGPRDPTSSPPASIGEIAKRFQRQICEHRFPKLGQLAPGTLTISGGLASFPHDAATADELVARADQLAIQSKRQGKNVITFGPGAERVCGVK
ncbi:MAG: GGDEF domain-containing protein [Phycisphaerales bacterium]